MWNEKEFFEDFVKESKKIEPDREFVAQLKNMAEDVEADEEKAVHCLHVNKKIHMRGYIAAAVILLLCVMAGGVTWNVMHKTESGSGGNVNTDVSGNIHAGKNDKDIHSGIIGDEKGINKASMLLEDDNVNVVDENGRKISAAKRQMILKWLNMAEKTVGEAELNMDCVSYFCEGGETLEIRIYGEEYIVIGGEDDVYKIKDTLLTP